MHILRILAVLGRGDQTASEGMYEVLGEVMRKADTGINVGYAIGTYVRTVQYSAVQHPALPMFNLRGILFFFMSLDDACACMRSFYSSFYSVT